ncbi:MAG: hypothetical protein KGI27_09885 [Thaumarchaeota archaeon]|nr:hypothetical protein [Nitrososphaerota archaeon]
MKKILGLLLGLVSFCHSASITSANWDQARTGANPNEVQITAANVNTLVAGPVLPVSGAVMGQPLVVPIGPTTGLITCTMTNDCYAFDAVAGTQLWHTNLGITPRTSLNAGQNINQFYTSGVGCVATPAVDLALGKVFAVCATSTPSWVLFSLDLTTGNTLGSVTVTGSVTGSGDPSGGDLVAGGSLTFYPAYELSRGGVTLANGNVYVTFASYNDTHPYHGWVMGYTETTLAPVGVFCTTPSGGAGGVWMAGGGIAVDSTGNLYLSTGNGTWDGTTNFANSILKLSPSLQLLDWFTPSNYAALSSVDADLASNRPILIPNTSYLVHTSKGFQVFVLSITNLGHLQGTPVQTWTMAGTPGNDSGAFGSLLSNGVFYIPTTTGLLSAFQWTGGGFNTTPVATNTFSVGSPGPSALAGTPGLVWVITTAGTGSADTMAQQGVLHALNSTSLVELWNSGSFGTMTKFSSPTVANGQIFIPTQDGKILVYTLPAQGGGSDVDTPASVPTANKTSTTGTIFMLAASDVATAPAGTLTCINGGLITTVGCNGTTSGGGAVTTISTNTVGTATPSVTFSNIPSGYLELELTITGRSDTTSATTFGNLQFNGDVGANYNYYNLLSNWNAGSTGQTSIHVCSFTGAGGSASYAGTCIVRLPLYSKTSFNKLVSELEGSHGSGSTSTGVSFGDWNNTAAITSITVTLGSGNFAPGTTFILRGLN